jgi:hypothetical protein
MLKPPGTKRLKLNCDVLLSTSAFRFSLRRYMKGGDFFGVICLAGLSAGAYTRPLLTST